MKNTIWAAFGLLFLGCAYIGTVIPEVPIIFFVILAVWAFGKSLDKFGIQIMLQNILNFIGSVKDVLRCILFIKPGIKELCGIKNQDLIVLGNGPSLAAELTKDLVFFKEKDTMCCNEFVHSDYYELIQPKYYVFLDPAYWRKTDVKTVNDEMAKTFKNLNEKTTWPLTIIMRVAGENWNFFIDLPKINTNINIVYFYNNGIVAPLKIKYYFYKKNRAMPLLYNVLGVSTFFALNMGYKKIFIAGADHSWHKDLVVKNNNNLYWKNSHFWDQEEADLTPIWVDSYQKETFKMHLILTSLSYTFSGYFELEKYSKYLNSKIYNITKGSAIDAFEKHIRN